MIPWVNNKIKQKNSGCRDWGKSSIALGLLGSEITPNCAWVALFSARDQTRVEYVQGKCLNPCAISLTSKQKQFTNEFKVHFPRIAMNRFGRNVVVTHEQQNTQKIGGQEKAFLSIKSNFGEILSDWWDHLIEKGREKKKSIIQG